MASVTPGYHNCDTSCYEQELHRYRERLDGLSSRIHQLKSALTYTSGSFSWGRELNLSPQEAARELELAIATADQITNQIHQEEELLSNKFQTVERDTLARLGEFKRDIVWLQARFKQIRKDAGRTAERAEDYLHRFGPQPEPVVNDSESQEEPESEPVDRTARQRVFESASDSDDDTPGTPRTQRRGWEDSPVPSDAEDEEPYTPPTCWQKTETAAQDLWQRTCRWVNRNRGFAFSIGLNVLLLTMRKFARTTCPAAP